LLLRDALDQATEAKRLLRQQLLRLDPTGQVPTPRPAPAQHQVKPAAQREAVAVASNADEKAPPATEDAIQLADPFCETTYDAIRRLTKMVGRAKVRCPAVQLAPILDPRSWSCGGGVIAAAFLVKEHNGEYSPTALDGVELGTTWKNQLLYEYARSEIASFENILAIESFTATGDRIEATYRLHDCLVCTFGLFSAPGGLTVNEGHVRAIWDRRERWWSIEVLKRVQVRDLTPRDPGSRYDFGQWVNSTIGAALSEWVNDTKILSPIL
jgi:hypothetical protein